MDTSLVYLHGTPLLVPDWLKPAWDATGYRTSSDFPDCCGAGDGLGNVFVPETIWFLRVSPACWIHDRTHTAAPPLWSAFTESNDLFRQNLTSMIRYGSNPVMRVLREYRVTSYFLSVDTVGARIFRSIKAEQGHDVAKLLPMDALYGISQKVP